MSLIGKKIKARSWSSTNTIETEGIVLEKYRGLVRKKHCIASGAGGVIDVENYFSIDYCIVKTSNGINKIQIDDIKEVLDF